MCVLIVARNQRFCNGGHLITTATSTHFLANLPTRPYCSDDLATGVQIRRRDIAVGKAYIQPNPPPLVSWLIFDCDHDRTFGAWDEAGLPPPNMAVMNRSDGRGHLFYLLRAVCRSNAARVAPLRFLANIEAAYVARLGADPQYSGLMAKNPLSDRWITHHLHPTVHTLGDLAEWVDIREFTQAPTARAALVSNGLGRNCTMFDRLRLWAYATVCKYREAAGGRAFEMFANACLTQAGAFNDFQSPMALSELRATAKSVAKWTWRHYQSGGVKRGRDARGITRHHGYDVATGLYLPKTPLLLPEEVAARRVAAGINSANQERQTTAAKVLAAKALLEAQGKPASVRAVAAAAGVDKTTAGRHLKKAKTPPA